MDPVDALNEIVFWLERELAPTFKVQACRCADGAIKGIDRDELVQRALAGRHKKTKGIGARFFEVIAQALEGGVPAYLSNLRKRSTESLVDGGCELRAAFRGDLHCNSN